MPPLVRAEDKIATVRDLLQKMVPQLALAVGADATAKRLARIATTSVLRNPRLLECDPKTLAGAVMECAQMGLEPDGREAHLVPFNNRKRNTVDVQLIPDYKGLAKLARNSGQVKTLDWREVRKGDHFKYEYGSKAMLEHRPSEDPIHKLVPEDPKKPDGKKVWIERDITHCYSLAILEGGEPVFEVMTVDDVEWHRDMYSRAAGDGPWVTNFSDMGAKTCFRKLAKKLPRSAQNDRLGRAVELDEKGEQGIPQDLGGDLIGDAAAETGAPPDAPKTEGKLDKLTGELKKNGHDKSAAPTETGAAPGPSSTGTPATSGGLTAPAAVPNAPPSQPEPTTPAPPKQEVSKPGDPQVEGARQPVGGTQPAATPEAKSTSTSPAGGTPAPAAASHPMDEPRAKVTTRIHDALTSLKLTGDQNKVKRDYLYGRYLGAGVTPNEAPLEKLEVMARELEKLVEQRKK